MSGGLEHLILSGPVLLAMPVAAAAGAITFLSPCCLPLVPGYLSYLTGMSGSAADRGQPAGDGKVLASAAAFGRAEGATLTMAGGTLTPTMAGAGAASLPGAGAVAAASGPEGAAGPPRSRVMLGTLLFILGFSALFATEGVAAASLGDTLVRHERGLTQILGGLVILLGMLFIGLFDRFSLTGRIIKPSLRPRAGLIGAPVLGVLFGIGWTPCSGPTLSAVLTLSYSSGGAARGGVLAFVYALGIGVPFLIVAFAFNRGINVFGFARRHARLITRIGGCMLIAVGLLEVTGAWSNAIVWLQVHWQLTSYNSPI